MNKKCDGTGAEFNNYGQAAEGQKPIKPVDKGRVKKVKAQTASQETTFENK